MERETEPCCVVVVGDPQWADVSRVKLAIKQLAPGGVVITDDEPYALEAAAMRQARCSLCTGVVFRQPGNGQNALQARATRDRAMYEASFGNLRRRVWVFGELPPDRADTLLAFGNWIERFEKDGE
jgi:hypothetical protein